MYGVVTFARSNRKITVNERADEAYALLKRKVFSWRQKDVSVNDWSRSDVGNQHSAVNTTESIILT